MLIKPKYYFKRITDITVEDFQKMKVDTVILDVDNTITLQKAKYFIEGAEQWLDKMKSFGIKLIILSNAKPDRMSGFAKKVGLPFVALGLKPLPFGYWRSAKRAGSKIKNCCIIGDQLFTDILGGNIARCKTVLVSPTELETSFGFKIKRKMERILLKLYKLPCEF